MDSSTKQYGVVIGRFQPIHDGHIHLLTTAGEQVDELLILVGSVNQCRSIKNPWTFVERREAITSTLNSVTPSPRGFQIHPINDNPYDDLEWLHEIHKCVESVTGEDADVTLFGMFKEGNDYLKWFRDWKSVSIEPISTTCATGVRTALLVAGDTRIPHDVADDYAYFAQERAQYTSYPYPDSLTLYCADAVVVCNDHVLLIQRKYAPGRGTWALPGGFRNNNETFRQCAVRELIEETGIAIDKPTVERSIVTSELFDSPKRSHGISRTTMAVLIRPNKDTLPALASADDAAECRWVPIQDALDNYTLFDDHAAIITSMTAVWPTHAFLQQRNYD